MIITKTAREEIASVIADVKKLDKASKAHMAGAVNAAMTSVKEDVSAGIKATYNIPEAGVDRDLHLRLAVPSNPQAILRCTGRARPLSLYTVSPKKFRPGVKVPVVVRIRKDRAPERTRYFMTTVGPDVMDLNPEDGYHVGIFKRDTKSPKYRKVPRGNKWGFSWLPIKEKYGPSKPSMMVTVFDERNAAIMSEAMKHFNKVLDEELTI